jgi:hypothetical protein
MERRKFTREFKLEAVRLIKDRGVSYVQASRSGSVAWESPFVCEREASLGPERVARRIAKSCGGSHWARASVEGGGRRSTCEDTPGARATVSEVCNRCRPA